MSIIRHLFDKVNPDTDNAYPSWLITARENRDSALNMQSGDFPQGSVVNRIVVLLFLLSQ